jgi:hypothetical protein
MFVYLANMRGIGDGEHKGLRRHALARRMFEARTSLCDRGLLSNPFEEVLHLPIGGRFDECAFAFTQFCRQTFESHILSDGHHGWTHAMGVQLAK